ncbi:sortase A [Blastococcus fimeti]|nr:sortase A [Blastococcus fimeti]
MVDVALELVLTAGVVCLLFVVYQTWMTNVAADQRQDEVAESVRGGWEQSAVPAAPDSGEGFAFVHIPELGATWSRAIVEGVDEDDLQAGPGHYPNSAMPGEIGNFAVAGHRNGQGSPFVDLDELEVGDPVIIETADSWFVYRVTSNEIVPPSTAAAIRPVPGGTMDDQPTEAYLTLTTCHPEFSVRERLIVHALLDSSVSKVDQPRGPAILASGQ